MPLTGFGIFRTTQAALVIKNLKDLLPGSARACDTPPTWVADFFAFNTDGMRIKKEATQDPIACRP